MYIFILSLSGYAGGYSEHLLSVRNVYRNDKVVTTLSQPWHNAFLQPCHHLGTTLYFETVARLLQGGDKAVMKALSQLCIMKL